MSFLLLCFVFRASLFGAFVFCIESFVLCLYFLKIGCFCVLSFVNSAFAFGALVLLSLVLWSFGAFVFGALVLRCFGAFNCCLLSFYILSCVFLYCFFVFRLLSFGFCLLSFVFCLLSFVLCLLLFVFCLFAFAFDASLLWCFGALTFGALSVRWFSGLVVRQFGVSVVRWFGALVLWCFGASEVKGG